MAALDLSDVLSAPATALVGASVGTNWQEVIIPTWCTVVTVTTTHSAYYALPTGRAGDTQPADGNAASGTDNKVPVLVAGSEGKFAVVMRHPFDRPAVVGVTPNRSIFLAAQSGTAGMQIELGVG